MPEKKIPNEKGKRSMVKVSQLYRFVAVVDAGSINKAAEHLYISQPTLSTSLKELENEMGKQLLLRSEKGVTLTQDGEMLYMYSQSVLKELQQIETLKESGGEPSRARLNISVYSLLVKQQLLVDLYKMYNAEEQAISINEVIFEEMVDNVCHGISEVGIGVINDIEMAMVKNMADARNLTMEIVDSGPLYLNLGKNNRLVHAERITAEDLKSLVFVHLPFDTYSILRRNVKIEGIAIGELKKSLIVNNYPLMVGMLNNIDAFMLGNKWQAEELDNYGVTGRVASKDELNVHLITLINEKKKPITDQVQMFLDLFKEYYVGKKPEEKSGDEFGEALEDELEDESGEALEDELEDEFGEALEDELVDESGEALENELVDELEDKPEGKSEEVLEDDSEIKYEDKPEEYK